MKNKSEAKELKTVSVKIEKHYWVELRKYSIDMDCPMADILKEALDRHLKNIVAEREKLKK